MCSLIFIDCQNGFCQAWDMFETAEVSIGARGTYCVGRAVALSTVALVGQTIRFALPIFLNCML